MIKSLTLTNFQGHKHSRIVFTPGINVVTGQTDSGKSSLVRAIWWVLKNRQPRVLKDKAGNDKVPFKFHGAGKDEEIRAELELSNGTVSRFRKGTKNGYELNGVELTAIRKDVPSEVSELLDLRDYNIQTQHQPYFLVADSPGDVAAKLNEVCGLDIIGNCLDACASQLAQVRYRQGTAEGNARQTEQDLQKYRDLDARDQAVQALQGISSHLEEVHGKRTRLGLLVEDLRAAVKRMRSVDDFLAVQPKAQVLFDCNDKIISVVGSAKRLSELIDQGEQLDAGLVRQDQLIAQARREFDKHMQECGTCPLCKQEIR